MFSGKAAEAPRCPQHSGMAGLRSFWRGDLVMGRMAGSAGENGRERKRVVGVGGGVDEWVKGRVVVVV